MKIYLIRHGQTTGDIEDRYGGDYNDNLTDLGKEQGEKLAQKLIGLGIEKIFCSPRVRAKEIAEIINKKLNCNIEVIDGLKERNQYGILTGMVKSDAKEKYPELVEAVKDFRNTIEKAENYNSFKKRIEDAMVNVLNSSFNVIAVVSHGGPIKVIFREVLNFGEVQAENCSFAELENNDGELKIVSLNGISLLS